MKLKPDTSLATKSGHFNLLPTVAGTGIMLVDMFSRGQMAPRLDSTLPAPSYRPYCFQVVMPTIDWGVRLHWYRSRTISINLETNMTTLLHEMNSSAQLRNTSGFDVTEIMMLALGILAYASVFSIFIAAVAQR
jgi:hypothetical protein